MKAVILAAGRGTRMKHLTNDTPKPMIKVAGKTLLEHKIDMLPDEIGEVILVIGYHGEQIKEYFGDRHNNRKITYTRQETFDGTGGALWTAREHLDRPFLVMMGDDIYCREDLEALAQEGWAIGVKKLPWLERGGRVHLDTEGHLTDITEGEHKVKNGMLNIGMFKLQPEIFSYSLEKLPGRDEYGLPQTVVKAAKDGREVKLVESRFWIPMTAPEDIKRAEEYFLKRSV